MGLLDGRSASYTGDPRARAHSPARSVRSTHSSTSKGAFVRPAANSRHNSNSNSFFGSSSNNNRGYSPSRRQSSSRGLFDTGSSRGIFNFGSSGGSGSSYYKRSPRQGYVSYLYNKLRRMVRELWSYARRHPMKAFFAVVVPLLSAGGAISGLMKQFGVRLPGGIGGGGSGGYYGSRGYERGGGGLGGRNGGMFGGGGGAGGLMENAGGIMQIAKAFM